MIVTSSTTAPSDRPEMGRALGALLETRRPVLATVSGSALYGTATTGSDDDIRAVFLPAAEEVLMGEVSFGLDSNRSNRRLGAGDIDVSAVSLMRFLALIGRMDMISCEILFAARDPRFRVIAPSEVFDLVWEARDKLIAGNANAAIGHARQRLGNFFPSSDASLETARRALAILDACRGACLADDPDRIAELQAIDGIEVVVGRKSRFEPERPWEEMTDEERATGRTRGGAVYVLVAGKRIGTGHPLEDARRTVARPLSHRQSEKRQHTRGGSIVWKDAYQAVRLLHQAIELHETRALTFPRPEAPLLRRIRAGEIPVPALGEMIDELMARIREAEVRHPFRAEPCRDAHSEVVLEAHRAVVAAS